MRKFFLAAILALIPAEGWCGPTTTLTLKVENVSAKGGDLLISLYNEADYLDDNHALASKTVAATPGETIVVWENLEPGTYAIKMMQDENRNGKMDYNLLGLPSEPYGISNDASPDLIHLSSPSFDAAKFALHPGENQTTITLREGVL